MLHNSKRGEAALNYTYMKRLIIFLMALLPMAYMLSTVEAKPNKQKVVLYVHLHCEDCQSEFVEEDREDEED